MANQKNQQVSEKKAELQEQQISPSERFTSMVLREFGSGVGEVALSDFQRRLAQNYFIAIDAVLKAAEIKRQMKKKDQDPLPVVWQNVNMQQLARNVVSFARMGLDPLQKNHISMVPYKNNSTNQYDIGFIEGYRGIELRAKKYGLDIPDDVVVEVVYSTDKFKPIKKDKNNKYESYEFEITNPFNRGEIVGGFYYHVFFDRPERNKLVVFTLHDIEKRKPKYASVEFWGGEKEIWEDGKKVGKEKVEGWYEKMVYKTIYRAAYNDITIDSQKIDEDYVRAKQMEMTMAELEVDAEINENANTTTIDVTPEKEPETVVEAETVTNQKAPAPEKQPEETPQPKQSSQPTKTQQQNGLFTATGPGF